MEPDIDAIYEVHFEEFFNMCWGNRDLDNLCYEHFANPHDQYRKWKLCDNSHDEYVFGNAFDYLYRFDAEGLVEDPRTCFAAYLDWKVKVAK